MPDALLGSAGLPDGFIGLGLLAVLPTVLPVVVPGRVPVLLPTDGELAVPGWSDEDTRRWMDNASALWRGA